MYFIENMPRSHILRLDCSEGQFKSVSIDETLLAAVIIVKKPCCAALNAFNAVPFFVCGDQATVAYSTIGRTKDGYIMSVP